MTPAATLMSPEQKRESREQRRREERERLSEQLAAKHLIWVNGESAKYSEPSDQQLTWAAHKAESRAETPARKRGVAVSLADIRPPYGCTCVHTRKKHKQSGTCRKGCPCTAGSRSRPRSNA